jgi:hypothetical protein
MPEILLFLSGAAVAYLGIALRLRAAGDTVMQTLARPFGAGGPGPRK